MEALDSRNQVKAQLCSGFREALSRGEETRKRHPPSPIKGVQLFPDLQMQTLPCQQHSVCRAPLEELNFTGTRVQSLETVAT